MIRVLLIFVNVFFLWLASLFSGAPSATVTAPVQVSSGEEFLVEVKITVNDAQNFLRYVMVIPEEFSLTVVQDDGAKYLYDPDTRSAKFLWSEFAGRSELNISFKIQTPITGVGEYEFTGKLVHLVNNVPESIALNPFKVELVGDPAAVKNQIQTTGTDSTKRPSARITVLRTVPSAPVNGEFFVDVSIDKGDLNSFIKVVDSLPVGCTASLVEGDGNNDFDGKNGLVIFRWYTAPSKPILNIRYKVTPSADLQGKHFINGHLSYVEDNKGKVILIPTSTVVFGVDPNAKAPEQPVVTTPPPVKETPVVTTPPPVKETPVVTTPPPVKETPVVTTPPPVKETPVVTTPPPVKETPVVTTPPPVKETPVVTTPPPVKETPVVTTPPPVKETPVVTAPPPVKETPVVTTPPPVKETPVVITPPPVKEVPDPVATNPVAPTEPVAVPDKTKVVNADNGSGIVAGINYSVQIAAMQRRVPVDYYTTTYNIPDPVNLEPIDGLNKYTTGLFNTYNDARNHRETLRGKGVVGPFVTAYNNGRRITVQEALMITNQPWVK